MSEASLDRYASFLCPGQSRRLSWLWAGSENENIFAILPFFSLTGRLTLPGILLFMGETSRQNRREAIRK
jgi:hypothetical protein